MNIRLNFSLFFIIQVKIKIKSVFIYEGGNKYKTLGEY